MGTKTATRTNGSSVSLDDDTPVLRVIAAGISKALSPSVHRDNESNHRVFYTRNPSSFPLTFANLINCTRMWGAPILVDE